MHAVRVLLGVVGVLATYCVTSHAAQPAIDGRIHAVAPKDIQKVIAVAQRHPYARSELIYRLRIVGRNEVEVYYGQPPKHYKDIETYLLVERLSGKWQVTRTMVMGRNDPVE